MRLHLAVVGGSEPHWALLRSRVERAQRHLRHLNVVCCLDDAALILKYSNNNNNKSETELTASVLKQKEQERPKTHKRSKERFLTGRNRTKRANFRGSPLFQATNNIKTEKQTINSTCVS